MSNLEIKTLAVDEILKSLTQKSATQSQYYAMYSSWWGGITTNPSLMMIPIDDHQVHRGDGVFEAMKAIDGRIYLVNEHLNRLDNSAESIGLKNPYTREQMLEILNQTLIASGQTSAIIRLFLSRGPGSFTPSPYDTLGSQVYVVVTKLGVIAEEKIKKGASLIVSHIIPKDPWLARIKSCNYLQNVLMKKETIDAGADFCVGVDVNGFITEGSTENVILLSQKNELCRPKSENILSGTTMFRAFELAKQIKSIRGFVEKDLTLEDLKSAKEVMVAGTTIDVLGVSTFEGKTIANGQAGDVTMELRELVIQDQKYI